MSQQRNDATDAECQHVATPLPKEKSRCPLTLDINHNTPITMDDNVRDNADSREIDPEETPVTENPRCPLGAPAGGLTAISATPPAVLPALRRSKKPTFAPLHFPPMKTDEEREMDLCSKASVTITDTMPTPESRTLRDSGNWVYTEQDLPIPESIKTINT